MYDELYEFKGYVEKICLVWDIKSSKGESIERTEEIKYVHNFKMSLMPVGNDNFAHCWKIEFDGEK